MRPTPEPQPDATLRRVFHRHIRIVEGAHPVVNFQRRIRQLECRFLVAARVREGTLRSLNQLGVPGDFQDLFNPLADFRVDVSSTALREQPARRPT